MGERGGLRPVADLELGEDVPDVGGHGLRADVQARGDLGVRQSFPEEPKDLHLSLAELTQELRSGPAGDAEGSQERSRPVRVLRRAQVLERAEGLATLLYGGVPGGP